MQNRESGEAAGRQRAYRETGKAENGKERMEGS